MRPGKQLLVRRLILVFTMSLTGLFLLSVRTAAAGCNTDLFPADFACDLNNSDWPALPELGLPPKPTVDDAFAGGVVLADASNSEGEGTDIGAAGSPFEEPAAREDSVFGRRQYGKLADNAFVYSGPSRGAGVVRNVGDGFLYATVNNWRQVNGERWYQINSGEYVHGDDLTLVPASDFQGVEINAQPERAFGWFVQDVVPSRQPDGEPDESFEELLRFDFFQVYDAMVGEEDWIWYDIGDGRWVRQTYVSLVHVSPRPAGVGPNDFWVEVDLYEQTFAAYEGDRMVYATLISSGLNRWPTREGLFQVWDRFESYKMSGAESQVDYYFIEDVPYIMYFDDLMGIALHGTYWHDRFGYKHSHGCVNMPILDAEWVFQWSAAAPGALSVWVHTSDPVDSL